MKVIVDFQTFVDEVKSRNPIEDIIEESGAEYVLNRRASKEINGRVHDSLQVNVRDGLYKWWANGEGGDVFTWLERRNPGWDFMAGLEYLARRVGLEMPRWNAETTQTSLEGRTREEVWSIAQPVMAGWLRDDMAAWAYVREGPTPGGKPRYFSERAIELSGIGFTRGGPEAKKAMGSVLQLHGVDPACPAAVAIVGLQGDVASWAARWGVTASEEWIKSGYISGLLGAKRLVYPHMKRGRVRYFSARNILGSEVDRDGAERKSYNLPRDLAGPHLLYYNWLCSPQVERLAVVEGPGDAIALGQMGMAGVAMLGLSLEEFADELEKLRQCRDKNGNRQDRTLYVGVDDDGKGWPAIIGKGEDWPGMRIFGPAARTAMWGTDRKYHSYKMTVLDGKKKIHKTAEVKDANEYLVAMRQAQIAEEERQAKAMQGSQAAEGQVGVRQAGGEAEEGASDSQNFPRIQGDGSSAAAVQPLEQGLEGDGHPESAPQNSQVAAATPPLTGGSGGGEKDKKSESLDFAARLNEEILGEGTLLVVKAVEWAAVKKGADRDKAIKTVLAYVVRMNDIDRTQHRGQMAKLLDMTAREFDALVKAVGAATEKVKPMGEPAYTWGGFIGGHLVEYLYDAGQDASRLAWRTPDGKIDSGESLEINGRWYLPYPPNDTLRKGAILFPSELVAGKPIKDLITYIEMFLCSVYLMPNKKMARLIAYWVLLTWLYDCFETTIYLRATGGAGAGKSEMMGRIGLLCYRTMRSNGAGSDSSLFRMVERYRGTVFIDEADLQQSNTEHPVVKFYNLGAMKGNPVWRTVEVRGPDGARDFEEIAFNTFCPKMIAMRSDFKDDAIGSRSLTIKVVSREMTELLAAKVPLSITREMREQAGAIQNLLLRWRLERWQLDIPVPMEFYDINVSARLNQVAGPLLAMASDDPDQQNDIRRSLREYYRETLITLSMSLEARVLEAFWKIWKFPDLKKALVKQDGDDFLIKIGAITKITNEIITEMNEEDDDDEKEGESKFKTNKKVSPRRVGSIIREAFGMQVTDRRTDGFWVYWNEPKLQGLTIKHGLKSEEIGPKGPAKPTQVSLV